ncbi:hypothetical protein C8R43DRAFT_961773 [Mycena crocata]|nr:hypothetical protein C8R43DRAFT_961773 [Mycena crocata]
MFQPALNSDGNADSLFETDISCLGLAGREESVMEGLDIGAMFSGSSLLDISDLEHPQLNCLQYKEDLSADDSTPTSPTNGGTPVSSLRSSPSRSSTPQRLTSNSRRDPQCTSSTAYKLAKHKRTHAPKFPKQFSCTMGCALEFSRKHDRLRHEVAQHGRLSDWVCRPCTRVFSSAKTMRGHLVKCKKDVVQS